MGSPETKIELPFIELMGIAATRGMLGAGLARDLIKSSHYSKVDRFYIVLAGLNVTCSPTTEVSQSRARSEAKITRAPRPKKMSALPHEPRTTRKPEDRSIVATS